MVNTEIRLIIFFAAKDGEAPYSQQKQDQELTEAQIMNSSLSNFRLKFKKVGENQLTILFAAKNGESPYSQQKQDQELTVVQIMNPLLANSDLNRRK